MGEFDHTSCTKRTMKLFEEFRIDLRDPRCGEKILYILQRGRDYQGRMIRKERLRARREHMDLPGSSQKGRASEYCNLTAKGDEHSDIGDKDELEKKKKELLQGM
uniref:Uncharacterized protein n=1 Tax=Chromera velia CCMP2878 TaxID=1169474 RepID=A0A0G4G0I0_9ALVE|eukprot:Cvel_4007.t1-p1 / transcript=Cvel_4007.t1 / gene=Cvel_4007 / organism=Chromera_velia_CCMP2878 / gene_product=hypothetical protein / transcript_product=hypothetical protein / location=Cvel_scaffold170:76017-77878(+) / protein_length=104 / sequence_SO=supercontig / SO=protein_coding / is_pseudo=false